MNCSPNYKKTRQADTYLCGNTANRAVFLHNERESLTAFARNLDRASLVPALRRLAVTSTQFIAMGDRTTPHNGNTGKELKLVYDAEIRGLLCTEKCYNTCCCISYDATRSYIWLLDGALEMKCVLRQTRSNSNPANYQYGMPELTPVTRYCPNVSPTRSDAARSKMCCTPGFCVPLQDNISKYYFDKKPFRPHGYCGGRCCYKEPKLEVMHGGCMCCCMHINWGPPCCAPKGSVRGSAPRTFTLVVELG